MEVIGDRDGDRVAKVIMRDGEVMGDKKVGNGGVD